LCVVSDSDGMTDRPPPQYLDHFRRRGKVGAFLAVHPTQSFHVVTGDGDLPSQIQHIGRSGLWVNGGFFVFREEVFDYIKPGEELLEEPFQRLVRSGQLLAHTYDGFWACMDTFKDKQHLDELYNRGHAPWEVCKPGVERARQPTYARA